ncbi:diacylglycerol kinase family protein [Agriterribacter sp.]|uniref:diacylglycerol kinase family protein n=1 Tax=Agriterribacter sp. TaxID=2821509 RepID=UPI002CFCEBD7|nr:diacylglycerol kinase family protein [Agriterribacter sp.]HRP55651.1 diacylglycerol kinase family protein [Agriterribacter sp.]
MKFIQSLQFARAGIITFFRHETNGRIQLVAATVAVILGWIFKIAAMEWLVILLCITAVLTLEMINTAIEKLCNVAHPGYHPQIKIIKDIAAGAVLLAAIGSVMAGAVVFLPKIGVALGSFGVALGSS